MTFQQFLLRLWLSATFRRQLAVALGGYLVVLFHSRLVLLVRQLVLEKVWLLHRGLQG